MKTLLCITGLPGAGKSSVANILSNLLNEPVVTMGDAIRMEAMKRGLEPTSSNLNRLMKKLREEEGKEIVAKLVEPLIEEKGEKIVIIDGVRNSGEIKYFKSRYFVVLIGVLASPLTRYNRLKRRGRKDAPKNFDEFLSRDATEISVGLAEVLTLSDHLILNDGSYLDLVKKCLSLWREVRDLIT